MKAIKLTLGGREGCLLFNGTAMFAVDEAFGGSSNLLKLATARDREGFCALSQGLAILAEQGELVRRHMGYDPASMLTEEEIRLLATPADIPRLTQRLMEAVSLGYGREVEEPEVDLILLELQQKKTRG